MGYGYCIALDYQGYVVACVEIDGSNFGIVEDTLRSWYHHEAFVVDKPVAIGCHYEGVEYK